MVGRLSPMPTVADIVKLYRISAKKHLSQNFLFDMNINRKIVKAAGRITNGYVCEVGPGPGGITRAILDKQVEHLVVIEKDSRFIPSLQTLSQESNNRLRVILGDVLYFDMGRLFPEELISPWDKDPPNIHIIGNLPFNVATPLIIRYLESISRQTSVWRYGRVRMTLTFQKEVADRIVSPILKDERCRLSAMCQNWCHVTNKFTIPGAAFVPKPKVDVGVVHFLPRIKPMIPLPFPLVEKVCKHVFHHRNKKLSFGVKTLFPPDLSHLTEETLRIADIPADTRSYMLTLSELGRLSQVYSDICDTYPHVFTYDYRSEEGQKLLREDRMRRRQERVEKQESLTQTPNSGKLDIT
ncbi:dimethyladenosine transferase 1, mitochondrial-like [Pecten maximus]|uniref:dimethyladenosine transferase 1, mitochondrial-like n=1 Tax=Pecten maximus TaxID=6579 RepID=UPI001457FF9E|nr:dimethyladenosine transferase 1, mitochondrial-like [Pecten maximus]XP_033736702.1 dimethyladenosine transferase 1, mitochondrial-like [Pecten maximus]XP_033736703.1 dimethyladenosine transferase 1, mitochondrial-like [Pecten maximus]